MAEAPDPEALDQLLKAYVNQTESEQTVCEDELIQSLNCLDPSTWYSHLQGIQNGSGETAVHVAVRLQHILLLELILRRLPDEQRLQLLETCEVTPLHTAASANDVKSLTAIFRFLTADQWEKLQRNIDEYGDTALDYAKRERSKDLIKFLNKAREDAFVQSKIEEKKKEDENLRLKDEVKNLKSNLANKDKEIGTLKKDMIKVKSIVEELTAENLRLSGQYPLVPALTDGRYHSQEYPMIGASVESTATDKPQAHWDSSSDTRYRYQYDQPDLGVGLPIDNNIHELKETAINAGTAEPGNQEPLGQIQTGETSNSDDPTSRGYITPLQREQTSSGFSTHHPADLSTISNHSAGTESVWSHNTTATTSTNFSAAFNASRDMENNITSVICML